jgi:hypothetical protein
MDGLIYLFNACFITRSLLKICIVEWQISEKCIKKEVEGKGRGQT